MGCWVHTWHQANAKEIHIKVSMMHDFNWKPALPSPFWREALERTAFSNPVSSDVQVILAGEAGNSSQMYEGDQFAAVKPGAKTVSLLPPTEK